MPLYVDGVPYSRKEIRDLVDCPKCESLATQRCTRPDGSDQDALHSQRWIAYEKAAQALGETVRYTPTPKDEKESTVPQTEEITLSEIALDAQALYQSSKNPKLSTASRALLASQAVFLKLDEVLTALNAQDAERELTRRVDAAMLPAGDDVIQFTRVFIPATVDNGR